MRVAASGGGVRTELGPPLEQLALEVLVRGELDGGVGDEDEGGHGARPETANALGPGNLAEPVYKVE